MLITIPQAVILPYHRAWSVVRAQQKILFIMVKT